MAGRSWLVDSNRFATKIRSASGASDPGQVDWKSNPTKACPNCQHVVDNTDVNQEWPGLPRGVKFDPSDQEIMWHLLAKSGADNFKPHPFIDEFIPTVDEDEGICYTHPENLPGVEQDGRVSHFFHRAIKAYNTGTRKRRKILGDFSGDVRWHKTGRTKPVILDGVQKGCKKIMVLYWSAVRGGKAEKTSWVMHQYHLGTGEDEKEGEYVISKVFYQQQQLKQSGKDEELASDIIDATPVKVDPVTPKSVTPDPPRAERRVSDFEPGQGSTITCIAPLVQCIREEKEPENALEMPDHQEHSTIEKYVDQMEDNNDNLADDPNHEVDQMDYNDNQAGDDPTLWDSGSQYLLDSQQLVEGLSLCDEFLQSQSPGRDGNENGGREQKGRLTDYAYLGKESLKKDLEACQALEIDPANLDLDTPPDFRLSQLSQSLGRDGYENGGREQKGRLTDYAYPGKESLKKDLEACQALEKDPANFDLDTPPDFRLSQLSQSLGRDGYENGGREQKGRLTDYAYPGKESLKKDLEACQALEKDPANFDLDTPPDFRLSQLEFESEGSFLAWGGTK